MNKADFHYENNSVVYENKYVVNQHHFGEYSAYMRYQFCIFCLNPPYINTYHFDDCDCDICNKRIGHMRLTSGNCYYSKCHRVNACISCFEYFNNLDIVS